MGVFGLTGQGETTWNNYSLVRTWIAYDYDGMYGYVGRLFDVKAEISDISISRCQAQTLRRGHTAFVLMAVSYITSFLKDKPSEVLRPAVDYGQSQIPTFDKASWGQQTLPERTKIIVDTVTHSTYHIIPRDCKRFTT